MYCLTDIRLNSLVTCMYLVFYNYSNAGHECQAIPCNEVRTTSNIENCLFIQEFVSLKVTLLLIG